VEDVGARQVPGKVRAADRWSAESRGSWKAAEGCGLPVRQQAVAFCRVDRAQPTSRASGVSCTPWLDGPGHGTTDPIRPARHGAFGTRGHGTRGHAPPSSGLAGTGLAGTPRRLPDSPGPGLACRQRAGHDGPSSERARRAALPRAVIRRATPGRSPTGRHPSGHATRVGRIGCPLCAAFPLGVGKPPNVQLSAAPLAGVWSVADVSRRQLPGNARAAGPWSARSIGIARAPGGCALSRYQQAEAFCRVNRAQPTNRASGVSCTAWLGRRIRNS